MADCRQRVGFGEDRDDWSLCFDLLAACWDVGDGWASGMLIDLACEPRELLWDG